MPDESTISRLRAIINRLENQAGRTERPPRDEVFEDISVWLSAAMSRLGLIRVETESGPVFFRETHYPTSHRHGIMRLDECFAEGDTYALLGQDQDLTAFDPRDALFLDLETTGLGHGTGTHAFLVGTAVFTEDSFVVTQYFMPDPSFEPQMLGSVAERARHKSWLVTYNGRGFDVPILETRFTLNRMRTRLSATPNFDLLFCARRLWRDAYACNLSSLESVVLGYEREGDVPGALIPSLYFDYLKSRNASLLAPVLLHNRWDILAMAALLGYMCNRVKQPLMTHLKAMELYNLGRLFERAGRINESLSCYRSAPYCEDQLPIGTKALQRLALLEKKRGNFAVAKDLWNQIADVDSVCFDAHLELAKHHEHRAKDYEAALKNVDAALHCMNLRAATNPSDKTAALLEDLRRRRERIAKKMTS